MADTPKDIADADKAYADAAAQIQPAATSTPVAKPAMKAVASKPALEKPAPVKPVATPPLAAAPAKPGPKSVGQKPAPKPALVKSKPAVVPTAAKMTRKPTVKPAAAAVPAAPTPNLTHLKDKIMASVATPDYSKPFADAYGEMQTRAKTAYDKGTVAMTEATEFAKGNVEALVESGKIVAGGVQTMGKTFVEEAKTAYETMTADVKELAAVKSPTELFQLQGKIMRRNFDAMVATSSKNTDAFIKLATEAFAPLSGRMNLAAEKLSTAA